MTDRSTLVLADLTSWEGWVHLAGALRTRGFDVVRLTGNPQTRRQRMRLMLERSVFSETHTVLGETSDAIDVRPLFGWLHRAVDIQMVDAVGAVLIGTPEWERAPQLRRVHAPGLDESAAYDKWAYTQLAQQHGIAVPASREINKALPDAAWVVKGRFGSGGERVSMADDLGQVRSALDRWGISDQQAFVQERIAGDLWNVGGVASRGDVLAAGVYRAYASPHDPQGPPVAVQPVERPDMMAATRELVHALGYHGPFAVDFIDDGTPYLLDFNPRFFGTWAALQSAGVDLLGAYLSILGRPWQSTQSPLESTIMPTSVVDVRGISQSWQRAREFTARTGPIIGGRASMVVTAHAMSHALGTSGDKPVVTIAYSQPWLAAIQFAAALRHRGIRVNRATVAPQTRLQKARVAAESLAFDHSHLVVHDDGRDVIVTRPELLVDDASDVQMTEGVLRFMLSTDAWRATRVGHHVADKVDERVLCDKAMLHHWAVERGINVPRQWQAFESPDRWPVIAKPVTGYGGIGVMECHDPVRLDQARQSQQVVVQEILPGPQINVGGVARDGEILLAIPYLPLPPRNHPTGPPVAIDVIESDEALEITETLISALEYTGPFCLDLMRDADGHLALLDLNGRIFGSWSGLQRAGADVIGAYLHSLDLAPAPQPTGISAGTRVTVDFDPSASLWQSWRGLTMDMRAVSGYRGIPGTVAKLGATWAHGDG